MEVRYTANVVVGNLSRNHGSEVSHELLDEPSAIFHAPLRANMLVHCSAPQCILEPVKKKNK